MNICFENYKKLMLGSFFKFLSFVLKFANTCLSVVDTIAPLKSRFIRENQAPFINKEIQRAVMVRSKLRKKFLKSRSKVTKKHTMNREINALVY